MVFSSFEFLFRFLPIFIILYYIAPANWRNYILFAGSILFYTAGEPRYVVLLLFSLVINYFLGRLLFYRRCQQAKYRQLLLLLTGLGYNFGMLVLFKYTNFTDTLPIGISFYSFQMAAYIIDIYRGKTGAESSFLNLGTFLVMFPHLTAGPIMKYQDVQPALVKRTVNFNTLEAGVRWLILGLGAKVIIADRIALLWNQVQVIGFQSISTPLAWMGIAAYSMELYFDFAGYSMMAIGLGKMLGFEIPMNFDHPYIAKSVSEFWRRWHITLGKWFRDYVYIPLGGNRKGLVRTIFNLLVVWILTAVWHGKTLNFLLWGGFLLFWIILEKVFLQVFLNKSKVFSHMYLLLIIPVSWTFFAITDLQQLYQYFTRLLPFLGGTAKAVNGMDYIRYFKDYGLTFGLGVVFATMLPSKIYQRIQRKFLGTLVVLIIFLLSLYYMSISLNNPFLYFSF